MPLVAVTPAFGADSPAPAGAAAPAATSVARDPATPLVLNVWPATDGLFPGDTDTKNEREAGAGTSNEQYYNVSVPTLTVYWPAPEKALGVAMIVSAGGGYTSVYSYKEAEQPAKWLVDRGFTAIVLKYRVPNLPGANRYLRGMQDLQRSMSLVRSKAKDWGLDPNRIGLIGFSAGGQMQMDVATNFTPEGLSYPAVDDIDKVSSRPDFVIMAYPGGLANRGATGIQAPEIHITNQTPPCFIAIGTKDSNGFENGAVTVMALLNAGVPAELHLYQDVGHGFGLLEGDKPINTWQDRMMDWMKFNSFLRRTDVANPAGPPVAPRPVPALAVAGAGGRGAGRGGAGAPAPRPQLAPEDLNALNNSLRALLKKADSTVGPTLDKYPDYSLVNRAQN
jgi:acetyl esterase/lipase